MEHLAHLKTMVDTRKMSGAGVLTLENYSERIQVKHNTSMFALHAFSAAAPKLWNTLPDNLRAPCSCPVFKSGLKTHLFCQAFDSDDIH